MPYLIAIFVLAAIVILVISALITFSSMLVVFALKVIVPLIAIVGGVFGLGLTLWAVSDSFRQTKEHRHYLNEAEQEAEKTYVFAAAYTDIKEFFFACFSNLHLRIKYVATRSFLSRPTYRIIIEIVRYILLCSAIVTGYVFGGIITVIVSLLLTILAAIFLPLIKLVASKKTSTETVEQIEKILPPSKPVESEKQGRITGYEPQTLIKEPLNFSSPHCFGEPGHGLHSSKFSRKNIEAGVTGEENFAKTLIKNGMHEKFATLWSLCRTDDFFDKDYDSDTDMDCILIGDKTIYVIDLKMYKQGNIIYRQEGRHILAYDAQTNIPTGDSYEPTQNMRIATENLKKSLVGEIMRWKVKPYIVFMPTKNGIGWVENVKWPGRIPAYALPEFLEILEKDSGKPWLRGSLYQRLIAKLVPLLKID